MVNSDNEGDILSQADKVAEAAWEKSPRPFEENLRRIAQILIKKGKKPKSVPHASIWFLDTSDNPTQGYRAELNLESNVKLDFLFTSPSGKTVEKSTGAIPTHHLSLYKNSPPKPEWPRAICDHDISVTSSVVNAKRVVHLNIDSSKFPKALNLEEPTGENARDHYKRIEGTEVQILSPEANLGPKTRTLLSSFTEDALKELENLPG